MNSWFVTLGIESWKPIVAALLMPPVSLLVLLLVGVGLLPRRRAAGWSLVLASVALLWLTTCSGFARAVSPWLVPEQSALSAARVADLGRQAAGGARIAIVVLGGGIEGFAPEYGHSTLHWRTVERLRYGLHLARQTGAPVLFTGGIGWADGDGTTEAAAAARIAAEEFRQPLRWIEDRARDTRENARLSLPLLRSAGIEHIVLVTHGLHMPRALRAFTEAAGPTVRIEAAPMGLAGHSGRGLASWLPSTTGFTYMRYTLHEFIGRLAGS